MRGRAASTRAYFGSGLLFPAAGIGTSQGSERWRREWSASFRQLRLSRWSRGLASRYVHGNTYGIIYLKHYEYVYYVCFAYFNGFAYLLYVYDEITSAAPIGSIIAAGKYDVRFPGRLRPDPRRNASRRRP